MNNDSILPKDLVTIVFEYVPSCTLKLLQANNGYNKLILQSPNIWKHYSINLYADLKRISHNNPLITLQSISIPNTSWSLYYQSYKSQITNNNNEKNESIYLNIYLSINTMNEIILDWLNNSNNTNNLLIPFEFVKKIRILCYLSHIHNTLNFLAHYLSNIKNEKSQSRLQIDMDCFMHARSQLYSNQNKSNELQNLLSIKNLIVDNCDLTRQFSLQQSKTFEVLPNLECLTLCCSYVSFYSSTLTTIHSMLFSSKYKPFYILWESFSKLKTIIISEKSPNRLYTDLRNTRQLIYFPNKIENLWFPHSTWFDLRRIKQLNVLCLDPCDVYINVFQNQLCMMDEIKINKNLKIYHLFINVASVTNMELNIDIDIDIDIPINNDNQNSDLHDVEQRNFINNLVSLSNLLSKAEKITFCTIPSESVIKALKAAIPHDTMKNVTFMNNIKIFQKQVHDEMGVINVFDNEYEFMIHNKTIRDQHAQICHLDIIDDILGSITYVG